MQNGLLNDSIATTVKQCSICLSFTAWQRCGNEPISCAVFANRRAPLRNCAVKLKCIKAHSSRQRLHLSSPFQVKSGVYNYEQLLTVFSVGYETAHQSSDRSVKTGNYVSVLTTDITRQCRAPVLLRFLPIRLPDLKQSRVRVLRR